MTEDDRVPPSAVSAQECCRGPCLHRETADILIQDSSSDAGMSLLQKNEPATMSSQIARRIAGQMLQGGVEEVVVRANSTKSIPCCTKYSFFHTWRVHTKSFGIVTDDEILDLRRQAESYLQLEIDTPGHVGRSMSKFVMGICTGALMILVLKASDVVVLLPFFARHGKLKLACFYVFLMFGLWFACWCVLLVLHRFEQKDVTHVEPVCKTVSLALVVAMGAKMFADWLYGKTDELVERASEEADPVGPLKNRADAASPWHTPDDTTGYWKFWWLSITTNFDKIGVFVPIMHHQVITPFELCLGNLVAAVLTATLMASLCQIQTVRRYCRNVPTFCVLIALFIYMLVAEVHNIERLCTESCANKAGMSLPIPPPQPVLNAGA